MKFKKHVKVVFGNVVVIVFHSKIYQNNFFIF
jgi:hypothetical protein